MGVVPPPCGDHAHRIRTTVPCPPGHGIGQLADLMPERAGNREFGGDPRDPRQDRSAGGTPPSPGTEGCLGHDGLLAVGPGASGGRSLGEQWGRCRSGSASPVASFQAAAAPGAGRLPLGSGALGCGRRPDAHGVWRHRVAGIGQLADGPGRRGRDDGGVEIRIVLDRAEPPVGRLRVVRAPGQAPGPRAGQEISFTGWLGLLRALYEVTAEPGQGARPGP
jgi:hypothetical protein